MSIREYIDLVEVVFGRKGVTPELDADLRRASQYQSAEAYADELNPVSRRNTDPPHIHARWEQERDRLITKWNYWRNRGMIG